MDPEVGVGERDGGEARPGGGDTSCGGETLLSRRPKLPSIMLTERSTRNGM